MGFNSWRLLTLSKQNFYVTKMAGELGSILRIQVKQKIVGFYTAEEGSTDFWLQVDISNIAKSRVMGLLVLCPKKHYTIPASSLSFTLPLGEKVSTSYLVFLRHSDQ